jgi:hypothetical protein
MNDSPEAYVLISKRATASKWISRTGQGLAGIVALLLLIDAFLKLLQLPVVLETISDIGWPTSSVVPLGVILLVSTILYILPRTAVLGAILLTAYLGGAVATHARIGSPIFTHTLFGVYVGALLWLGLVFRNPILRRAFGFLRVDPDESASRKL